MNRREVIRIAVSGGAITGLAVMSAGIGGCSKTSSASAPLPPAQAQHVAKPLPKVTAQGDGLLSLPQIVHRWRRVRDGQVIYYCFDYINPSGRWHSYEVPQAVVESRQTFEDWQQTLHLYQVEYQGYHAHSSSRESAPDPDDFPSCIFVSPPPRAGGSAGVPQPPPSLDGLVAAMKQGTQQSQPLVSGSPPRRDELERLAIRTLKEKIQNIPRDPRADNWRVSSIQYQGGETGGDATVILVNGLSDDRGEVSRTLIFTYSEMSGWSFKLDVDAGQITG